MLQRYLVAYLFILPVLLLYVVFVLRPTVQTFWLAFYEWNGISVDREWVGLANFQRLLGDPIFWQALQHSLIWTAVVVTFNLVVGLAVRRRSWRSIRGRLFFQLGYFLPVVQASIVTAMIWRWIYAPTGVLNTGLETWVWGFSPGAGSAISPPYFPLAIASSWMTFGLSVVILLAGMQSIDPTLYDAARVDGAGYGRMFLDITIPVAAQHDHHRDPAGAGRCLQGLRHHLGDDRGRTDPRHGVLHLPLQGGFQQNQYGYGSAIAVALAPSSWSAPSST